MTEQLPPEFMPFGHVVWRVIRAVGDTAAGPDSDPEAIPVTGIGLVRFTPLELTRVVAGTVPSTWVQQETIAADLDSEGFLALSGARGLLLWPGAWRVSAGGASAFSFPAFTIEVTSAHTADAPLDLWTAAPYSPPSGTTVTTLVVPAGASAGQILAWDGQRLVWTDSGSGGSGEPGEPGHSPVLTWQGDQIAVDGVVSGPHLTGPAGDPGDDGVTPATPQFTASATTLAAGSQATATVTGDYPALNLALGIPRGADGTGGGGSALQIVGAGRPDITSSMTTAVQGQVAAATVGTEFVSTDGPQGAWVWRRRTSGWVCIDGDTGERAILRPGSPTDAIILRRIGSTVSCTMGTLQGANYGAWSWGRSLDWSVTITIAPQGFATNTSIPGAVYADGKHSIPIVMVALSRGDSGEIQLRTESTVAAEQLAFMRAEPLIWNTSDQWPSTLPGTPA